MKNVWFSQRKRQFQHAMPCGAFSAGLDKTRKRKTVFSWNLVYPLEDNRTNFFQKRFCFEKSTSHHRKNRVCLRENEASLKRRINEASERVNDCIRISYKFQEIELVMIYNQSLLFFIWIFKIFWWANLQISQIFGNLRANSHRFKCKRRRGIEQIRKSPV